MRAVTVVFLAVFLLVAAVSCVSGEDPQVLAGIERIETRLAAIEERQVALSERQVQLEKAVEVLGFSVSSGSNELFEMLIGLMMMGGLGGFTETYESSEDWSVLTEAEYYEMETLNDPVSTPTPVATEIPEKLGGP